MRKFTLLLLLVSWAALSMVLVTAQDDTEETTPAEEVVITRESAPSADSFKLFTVVAGLQNPLYVTHAGDSSGRLFVVEQSGRIWVVINDLLQNQPFIDLTGIVNQAILFGYSEGGLLGLAFHPNYEENGLFYVNYTDVNGTTRVVRYTVSEDNPNVADPSTATELFSIGQPYPNHNGGHMDFGPDGYLYISLGDGGSRDDPLNTGQNKGDLLGSILRIDVDNPDEGSAYGIPQDNPFFTDLSFAPEVWAWGLRNVWRFSFDRATGDFYLADVGQNNIEEINFQPADSPGGENYGWRAFEGDAQYIGNAATDVVMPIATYTHADGCSVTGGYVYRGEAIPDMQGAYFYSDYCSGLLWTAYRDTDENWQDTVIMDTGRRISSFGEDEAGELYLVDYDGAILRFEPTNVE